MKLFGKAKAAIEKVSDAFVYKSSGGAMANMFKSTKSDNLKKAFIFNELVNAAVKVKAEAFSSARVYVQLDDKENKVAMRQLQNMFYVCGQRVTYVQAMEMISMDMDIYSTSYWKIDNKELHYIEFNDVSANTDINGNIESYYANNKKIFLEELVLFRESGGSDKEVISGVQAAYNAVELEEIASFWNSQTVKNSSGANNYYRLKGARFDNPQIEALVADIQNRHMSARNTGGTMIGTAELEVVDLNKSEKDVEYAKLYGVTRDKILPALRVPKELLGMVDGTVANSGEARVIFFQSTIVPRLTKFTAQLSLQSKKILGKEYEFKFDDPTPKTDLQKAEVFKLLSDMGAITPNEVRAEYGLEPIQGGDLPTNNSNLITLSEQPEIKKSLFMTRGMVSDAFVKRADRYDSIVIKLMKSFWGKQKKAILKRLEGKKAAVDIDFVMFDEEEEYKALTPLMLASIREIITREGREALQEIAARGFDVNHPDVQRAMRDILLKTRSVNITIEKELRKQITAGVDSGESIAKISKRITQTYDFFQNKQSVLIARTVTTSAANVARINVYKQNGVEEIEWIAENDSRTRDSHRAADGQVVKIGERFQVGSDRLEEPGDPNGSVEEIAQCRCTIAAVV